MVFNEGFKPLTKEKPEDGSEKSDLKETKDLSANVHKNALNVSPEKKDQLTLLNSDFNSRLEKIEKDFPGTSDIEGKNKAIDTATKEYIGKTIELTGTTEYTQSIQQSKFTKETQEQNNNQEVKKYDHIAELKILSEILIKAKEAKIKEQAKTASEGSNTESQQQKAKFNDFPDKMPDGKENPWFA